MSTQNKTSARVGCGRLVRRILVPQWDGATLPMLEMRVGRWRIGAGMLRQLPSAPWYTRYVYIWRHPGRLYPPHWQARILHLMVGVCRDRLGQPNTPVTDAEPSTPANTRAQSPRSMWQLVRLRF